MYLYCNNFFGPITLDTSYVKIVKFYIVSYKIRGKITVPLIGTGPLP